jgi:hypothetical protein
LPGTPDSETLKFLNRAVKRPVAPSHGKERLFMPVVFDSDDAFDRDSIETLLNEAGIPVSMRTQETPGGDGKRVCLVISDSNFPEAVARLKEYMPWYRLPDGAS